MSLKSHKYVYMHTPPISIPYSVVSNCQLPSGPPLHYLGQAQSDIPTTVLYCAAIDWLTFELRSRIITAESSGA